MARNRNFVNQGNRLMLQGLEAEYFAPKTELDLAVDFKGFQGLNLAQLKAKVQTDFVNNYLDENGNKTTVHELEGHTFHFRDGKSDVYTKGGLDYQVVEYLDRQQTQSQKWRMETNSTIDFKAGGKIVVAGQEFLLAKVLTILTTGTRGNKFLAMRSPVGWQRYGNKMLVLM